MVNFNKIKRVGLGFGFGGAFSKESKYNLNHKKTLKFFCKTKLGNFIDTSISYGDGDSEKIIGKIKDNIKQKNFISTKVTAENLTFDKFISSTLKSWKNLHVKKIDLIQPHWPNYDVKNDEIIKAFKHLKRDKKVRFFGLSNYDLKDIKYFKKKLKDSFKFIQDEFSIRDRSLENKIKYCEKNNIKIICYSPFGSGEIVFSAKENEILNLMMKKYRRSRYSIILNYLAGKSKNIILIPHTKKITHLKDNLSSLKFKLNSKDVRKLDFYFKPNYIHLKLKDVVYYNKKYKKITNLKDALNNKGELHPSPKTLSKILKKGHKLKLIKLKKINNKFHIKEGRLRYWAHVIAYGWNKKIKMMIA